MTPEQEASELRLDVQSLTDDVEALRIESAQLRSRERALRERIEAVLAVACHHCGQTPDEDGDHSCVCFVSDSECLWHTCHPVAPLDLIRAALATPATEDQS